MARKRVPDAPTQRVASLVSDPEDERDADSIIDSHYQSAEAWQVQNLTMVQRMRPFAKRIEEAEQKIREQFGERALLPAVFGGSLKPSLMVAKCGKGVAFHPRFWEEILFLGERCSAPFDLRVQPYRRGQAERKNVAAVAAAAKELLATFRALIAVPKRNRKDESRLPRPGKEELVIEDIDERIGRRVGKKKALNDAAAKFGISALSAGVYYSRAQPRVSHSIATSAGIPRGASLRRSRRTKK
jgi:hypothetical protein